MKVACWRFRLRLLTEPGSLKEKRSVVSAVLARIRRDKALSAAEVGDSELYNAATIGVCTVGTDAEVLERALERCRYNLENDCPVEIFEEQMSIDSFGEHA